MGKYALKDILKELTNADMDAIRSIYTYRCLLFEHLRELHYKRNPLNNRVMGLKKAQEKVARLVEFGVFETEVIMYQQKERTIYWLTSVGVEILRQNDYLPTNTYDENKRVIRRGYFRASELRINPKNVNHQMQLNDFILSILPLLEEQSIAYRYQDEKRLEEYAYLRPDGVLRLLDTHFFIEMDMGTESKDQLKKKWEGYRAYLHQNPLVLREKKLIMLFVCENVNNIKNRKQVVEHTIIETIGDIIHEEFEIYVGGKEMIFDTLMNVIIPQLQLTYEPHHQWATRLQEQGYQVYEGSVVHYVFNHEIRHLFYTQKIQPNGMIELINQRAQDFFVDDFTSHALSIYHRLLYINTYQFYYQRQFARPLQTIIVVNSEEEFIQFLKPHGFNDLSHVYITTPSRLLSLPLHEALFVCTKSNEIYHFASMELAERIYEQTISMEEK